MPWKMSDAGLLRKLPARGRKQLLAGQDETARQGELAAEGINQAGDQQNVQRAVANGEGDDVDGHREARRQRVRFGHEAILGIYRHLDNKSR